VQEEGELFEHAQPSDRGRLVSLSASLIRQGKWRLYTLTLPSELLADTCVVTTRIEDPRAGFQRELEQRRAQDIADYIDTGFGTIPGSIILSAQPEAEFQYDSGKKLIQFRHNRRAFFILDGQHRVYGFSMAKKRLRVPVVIYKDLSRQDETRLFMDINTKQRPVPTALLLDIRRQAGTEKRAQAFMRDVFDHFNTQADSSLNGLLSPAKHVTDKISRVTFNQAFKPIQRTFKGTDSQQVYVILNAYLAACLNYLRAKGTAENITNPTLFKALLLLFPRAAEKVELRYQGEYTSTHFDEILAPILDRIPKKKLTHPPAKLKDLWKAFEKVLVSDFSIDVSPTTAAAY
jgi:DGQHR domain-containing protein